MEKIILSEELLKEAATKACETELKIYDKIISDASDHIFSDKFNEKIQKMIDSM